LSAYHGPVVLGEPSLKVEEWMGEVPEPTVGGVEGWVRPLSAWFFLSPVEHHTRLDPIPLPEPI